MKRFLLCCAVILIASVCAFAQNTSLPAFDTIFEGGDHEVAARLLTWYNAAMIFITYFVTYVSSKIPFLNQISNKAWRAAVIATLISAVFYRLGADGLGVAVGFLTVLNPYELFMKPTIGKTPDQTGAKPAQGEDDDIPFA